jgi:hypothetical protein
MSATVAPQDAPIRAWRYWQMSPRLHLRSVAQRHVEWWPGTPLNAVCIGGGHPAPAAGCWCGVSGARDLDVLREHGLCVLPGPLAVGEVDLWGRILEESYGYRGEHALPASIGLVRETIGVGEERQRLLDAMSLYRVPVTIVPLDEAVAGTTAQMLAFQVMSSRASRGEGASN